MQRRAWHPFSAIVLVLAELSHALLWVCLHLHLYLHLHLLRHQQDQPSERLGLQCLTRMRRRSHSFDSTWTVVAHLLKGRKLMCTQLRCSLVGVQASLL